MNNLIQEIVALNRLEHGPDPALPPRNYEFFRGWLEVAFGLLSDAWSVFKCVPSGSKCLNVVGWGFGLPSETGRDENYNLFRELYGPGVQMPRGWPESQHGGDPLVLALNDNAVTKTVDVGHGVYFDFNASGFAEKSGWVSPGVGLLCMDRNGNGTIDDGSELFGNQTLLPNGQPAANGFQALAALDSHHDGKIDAQDPAYSQLRVWVQSASDGISQPDELHTLPELGIDSIDLNWTTVNTTDVQGNIENSVGRFLKADGTIGAIAEYTFQTLPYYTIPKEALPVPDDIAALPDLPGSGTVYNLQQAMVRDSSGRLEALVKQFAAENDPNARTALMDQILFQWTGSENIDPNSRGGNIDARKLAVLKDFFGEQWSSTVNYDTDYNNPNPAAAVILDGIYHDISEAMYGMLMVQTHFKDLFGMINYIRLIRMNSKSR